MVARSTGRTCGRTRPTSSTSTSRRAAGPRSRRGSCSRRRSRRATGSTPATRPARTCPSRAGSEEYLDSEKYEVKQRTLQGPLLPLIRRLNEIRRAHPALQRFESLTWLETHSDDLIAYAKREGEDVVITVVNLDPAKPQEGLCIVPPELGLPAAFTAVDLLADGTYRWRTGRNYVGLPPGGAHVIAVGPESRMTGLGEIDLYLAGEGRHERLYERLGAHCVDGGGVRFAVWAPNAHGGLGRRRLELLERGRRRAALARLVGDLGGRRRERRRGAAVQARRRGRRRDHAAQGRSVRRLRRGAAGERVDRLPQPVRVVGRRVARAPPRRRPGDGAALGLRGPRRLVAARALVARARRAARPVRRRARLHARRADAGDAAPLRAVVGLSGQRLLRAAVDLRDAGRLPRARRRVPRRRHRRAARLGAGALPARRVGARPLRRHGALRARRPAPRSPSRLGHADLQPLAPRGAELPARERALLGARVPRRRAPRRRRRLDALPRLLA